ncbi:hypothetical protein L3Y34_012077 [Caenorhabditis briggsae]|uniref:SPK domain-containing protein n=1 Tax=Caenorhabditis briggsae TaxID=6238 RepID=A0AAE8ZUR3_CAEBR|nr:hypothetical protein L3Y34_012077 [Caenorhabditis briggsae]
MVQESDRRITILQVTVSVVYESQANKSTEKKYLIGYSLMEKLQLVFIFSRPVSDRFVEMLKDAKFEIRQDDMKRISRFSTEDGRVVRFSDHLRKMAKKNDKGKQQGENKNPKGNQEIEEERVEDIPIELDGENMDTGIKQPKMQKRNQDQLSKEEFGDIGGGANHGSFNGRINYVELGKKEWVNPGLGTFIRVHKFIRIQTPPSSSTVSVKRVRAEEEKGRATAATWSDSFTTSANQNILKVGNSEQTPTKSSKTSVQLSNSVAIETATQKPSKVGALMEKTPKIPPQKRFSKPTSDERKISILELAIHIKKIALFINLDGLQEKASQSIEKVNNSGEGKTLSVRKFNVLFSAMLIFLEENGISENETSLSLKWVLNQLRLFLIEPLGPQIVHEAIDLVAKKIEEFGNKNYEVSPDVISEALINLLKAAGFCNQLV